MGFVLLGAMLCGLLVGCTKQEAPDPVVSQKARDQAAGAPEAPNLSSDESRAVEQVFADSDEADAVFRRLARDPKAAMADGGKRLDALRQYYYSPQVNEAARIIRELAEKDGRYEGAEKIEWRVPTSVDIDGPEKTIAYDLCSSLGTFRVFDDGREVEQERTPLRFSVTANPAYEGSRVVAWRTSKIKESGSCAQS